MSRISQNRPPPNPLGLSRLFSIICASKTPVFCKKIVAPASPKPTNPFKLNLMPPASYPRNGTLQTHCSYPELFQWFKCEKGPIFEQRIMARVILVSNRTPAGIHRPFAVDVTSGSHSQPRATGQVTSGSHRRRRPRPRCRLVRRVQQFRMATRVTNWREEKAGRFTIIGGSAGDLTRELRVNHDAL